MMARANMTKEQISDYVDDEAGQAKKVLAQFMAAVGTKASRSIARHINTTVAHEVLACAREVSAQLIVVGTHRRTRVAKVLLGSVAQDILQTAEQDVLAVPPSAES